MKKTTYLLSLSIGAALILSTAASNAKDTLRIVRPSGSAEIVKEELQPTDAAMPELGENEVIVENGYRSYAVYTDTVITIVNKTVDEERVEKRMKSDTIRASRRHQLQMYLGGGWGSLNYGLSNGGTVSGAPHALAEIDYAYFFHKYFGIGVGLRVSNTTSVARLAGSRVWNGVTDTDGETYNHTTDILSWRERETMHTLDVPVMLESQFYFNDKEKAGMYFDLGASLRVTGMNRFNVKEGNIEDKAYYPATHLTLTQMHEFGNRDMRQVGNLGIKRLGAGVFADMGFLFRIGKITDLALGGYFQYTVTDMNIDNRQALGFANSTFSFMNNYVGAMNTSEATAAHPWEAGLKIGLRIRPGKDKVTQIEERVKVLVPVERRDTMVDLAVRRELIETVEPKVEIDNSKISRAKKQPTVIRDHVVYFNFDKSYLNEEAVKYLDSILGELKSEQFDLVIDGHACEMGNPD